MFYFGYMVPGGRGENSMKLCVCVCECVRRGGGVNVFLCLLVRLDKEL